MSRRESNINLIRNSSERLLIFVWNRRPIRLVVSEIKMMASQSHLPSSEFKSVSLCSPLLSTPLLFICLPMPNISKQTKSFLSAGKLNGRVRKRSGWLCCCSWRTHGWMLKKNRENYKKLLREKERRKEKTSWCKHLSAQSNLRPDSCHDTAYIQRNLIAIPGPAVYFHIAPLLKQKKNRSDGQFPQEIYVKQPRLKVSVLFSAFDVVDELN